VQATVDEFKELNLGTKEDPWPIYASPMLTPNEQKEYFELLSEYKDVFAWSYNEMLRLKLKGVVQNLAIRKGVSPKKISLMAFSS